MFHKLAKRNINGKFLNIIKNMYSKSKMRIAWNKKITLPFESTYGVLQGGVLSPKLFNEFLSDLNEYLDPQCGVKID